MIWNIWVNFMKIAKLRQPQNGAKNFFKCEFLIVFFVSPVFSLFWHWWNDWMWLNSSRLITFDQQFRPQIVVGKCTFHHLSHQQKLDQYTNIPLYYHIKPSPKIAFKTRKIWAHAITNHPTEQKENKKKEKRSKQERCKLIQWIFN